MGKIFFNTKGFKEGLEEITAEQKAFLHYVETGEVTDELTKRIDNKVKEIREDKKWRSAYMKTLTHDQDVYDSGHEAGMKAGHEAGMKAGHEAGLKALVNTLKPILKTPEKVLENIVLQEGFEDTTIEDVKKYW